jgi:hypothetical protein
MNDKLMMINEDFFFDFLKTHKTKKIFCLLLFVIFLFSFSLPKKLKNYYRFQLQHYERPTKQQKLVVVVVVMIAELVAVAVEKVETYWSDEDFVVADEHTVDERRKMILLAVAVFAFPPVDDCSKVLLSVVSVGFDGGPVALVVVEGTAMHFDTEPVAVVVSSWQRPSSGSVTAFVVVADGDSD